SRAKITAAVLHALDKTQKTEQPAKRSALILAGSIIQRAQIGLTLRPAGQTADGVKVTRFPVYVPNQIGESALPRFIPPFLQQLDKAAQPVAQLRADSGAAFIRRIRGRISENRIVKCF